MPKFHLITSFRQTHTYEVEAESLEQAREMWHNGEVDSDPINVWDLDNELVDDGPAGIAFGYPDCPCIICFSEHYRPESRSYPNV